MITPGLILYSVIPSHSFFILACFSELHFIIRKGRFKDKDRTSATRYLFARMNQDSTAWITEPLYDGKGNSVHRKKGSGIGAPEPFVVLGVLYRMKYFFRAVLFYLKDSFCFTL